MRSEMIVGIMVILLLLGSMLIPNFQTQYNCEKLGYNYADRGGCYDDKGDYNFLFKVTNLTSGETHYEVTRQGEQNEK